MARLIGPDEACRVVYLTSGTNKGKAAAQGYPAILYIDEALTTPADILTTTGDAIADSQVMVDAYSRMPLVQYPDGVDTLWTSINGGPAVPMFARVDDRLDSLGTRLTALEPGGSAAAATAAALTSEAATRANADTALSTSIGSEAVARANADTALDAATVHKTGAETIAGVKTFSSEPVVPTPTQSTSPARKDYVDTSFAAVNGSAQTISDANAAQARANLSAAALGGTNPSRVIPPRTGEVVVANLGKAGHGWTQSGNGSSQLNDTSTFSDGSQSLRATTDGAGTYCNLNSPAFGPALDMTGKIFAIKIRIAAAATLSQTVLYAGDAGLANHFAFVWSSGSGGDQVMIDGEWCYITLPWGSPSMVTSGTPNRTAITNLRIGLRDINNGTPITANIAKVVTLPEPLDVFPSGFLEMSFDDGYLTHRTVAAPYLGQYGIAGTEYPICDRIDSGGGWMSSVQLQELQNQFGWTVGLHAYTAAHHDSTNGLTDLSSADQAKELRLCRDFAQRLGLRGVDYLAYPKGLFSSTLIGNARQFCSAGRTTYRKYRESWPPADRFKLRTVSVSAAAGIGDTVSSLQAEIDKAVAGRYVLHLCFHDLISAATLSAQGGSYSANQFLDTDFRLVVDYAVASGIQLGSIEQLYHARPKPITDVGLTVRDLGVGQETSPRALASVANQPGSGTMRLSYFTARKTEKVGSVVAYTGGAAASAITLSRIGLYTVGADGSSLTALIASTADDTSLFSAINTEYTKAFSTPVQLVAGQRYAIAPLILATTTPSLYGPPSPPAALLTKFPRTSGAVTGQTDLPASVTSGSIVTSGFSLYFSLLPV